MFTQETDKETFINLAEKMYDSIKIYGSKTVLSKLNELQIKTPHNKNTNDSLLNKIINSVCVEYSVEPNALRKSRVLGNVRYARTTCILLLQKHLSLSVANITRIFGRDSHSVISLSIKEFHEMKPTIKHHKDFIDKYNLLDAKIVDYKQELIDKEEI